MRIIFYGTPDFAVPSLEALAANPGTRPFAVITQPDRPAGRGEKMSQSPVKRCALRLGIEVLQPEKLRRESQSLMQVLRQHGGADIAVVAAFGQILPKELLDFPAAGSINVHASLLPRWRGAAPIQRAILAGDQTTGISLMRMTEGLDTGPVYCRKNLPILPEDNFGSLHDKLALLGADLLLECLPRVMSGELEAVPQDETQAVYASKIEKSEAAIDWRKTAKEICLQVRAFAPVPGAFGILAGKRMKILKAEAKTDCSKACAPGTIVPWGSSSFEVQCGEGCLLVEALQPEGKRCMQAEEFLRGNPISPALSFETN